MQPGQTCTLVGTYMVTAADIAAGSIENIGPGIGSEAGAGANRSLSTNLTIVNGSADGSDWVADIGRAGDGNGHRSATYEFPHGSRS